MNIDVIEKLASASSDIGSRLAVSSRACGHFRTDRSSQILLSTAMVLLYCTHTHMHGPRLSEFSRTRKRRLLSR
ncbi:hypothetical protein Cob_v000515 [Colletotrichum orbiculare MAFF 240422]|uniref:Uncharacterized protein n=1 Tax=Colletotrichum orbiculare (strain 104-T / ATCC 96160 / CBS 514.97 / LARS 414 / MAFF 240422) TaxID=1213857 RepID=A0A484G9C1_COLOR|nr:hypothetical protein Cob_v000515 [Colletotrichum orbiculare MAFF 240422]